MKFLLYIVIVLQPFLLSAQKPVIDSGGAIVKGLNTAVIIPVEPHYYGLRVFTENDFLSPLSPNRDDNYTGGLKVDFITNGLEFLRLGRLFRAAKWNIVMQNLSYGLTVFTPQDLANNKIIRTDRPYACYEFISAGSSFIETSTRKNILGYELFAGRIGSQVGNDFQTTIHKNHWFGTTRPVPQGWQYQVADGGALALNLRLFTERNIFETEQTHQHFNWLQTSWMHEVNFGQYLINYAQSLRFSLININRGFGSSFSGINNPTLPTIIKANVGEVNKKARNDFNFNIYVTPRVRVVVHNATLTGNLLGRNSVYTLSQKNVVPALLEYDLGMNLRWRFLSVGANLSGRSREFSFEEKAFHNWGGVYLALVYRRKR